MKPIHEEPIHDDAGKMGFDKRTRVIPPEGVDEEPEYGTDVDLDTTDAVVGNTIPSEERVTWSGPRRHAKGQTTSRVTTGTVITKLDTPPVEQWETEYTERKEDVKKYTEEEIDALPFFKPGEAPGVLKALVRAPRAQAAAEGETEQPTGDRICATCGKPIAGRPQKRYCSTACQVRASRQQKAKQAPNTTPGT